LHIIEISDRRILMDNVLEKRTASLLICPPAAHVAGRIRRLYTSHVCQTSVYLWL